MYQPNNMEILSPSWKSVFQQNSGNCKVFGCSNTFNPQQCCKIGLETDLRALLKGVGFVG